MILSVKIFHSKIYELMDLFSSWMVSSKHKTFIFYIHFKQYNLICIGYQGGYQLSGEISVVKVEISFQGGYQLSGWISVVRVDISCQG